MKLNLKMTDARLAQEHQAAVTHMKSNGFKVRLLATDTEQSTNCLEIEFYDSINAARDIYFYGYLVGKAQIQNIVSS